MSKTLARVSPIADRSAVWVAIAGCLVAFGGRFGRRAAMRGLLSLVLSSLAIRSIEAVAALPSGSRAGRTWLHPIVGRRRPARAFPSVHAASAVGFAVGAGQELPVLAGPLGLAAAAVGWSRLRTRAHHTGEVLAGALVGGAVAAATRQLWPVAPHHPAVTRAAPRRVGTDKCPKGDGLSIVVNSHAGPALSPSPSDRLRDELPEAEIIEVDDSQQFADGLRRASEAAIAIGVAGGDGSINAAAEVATAQDKALVVIPAGTLNHFARDLGLGGIDDAIDAIKAGDSVEVDTATIADRLFLNTASFGSYVDLVDARERLEHRIGKWPAVIVALIHVLRRGEPVDVKIDGRRRQVWMIFVGNCCYLPAGFTPSWRERLDDGQLDVRVVDSTHPFARTRLVVAALSGRVGRCRVYDAWTTKAMHVESLQGPIRLSRDGETFDGPEEFVVCKSDTRLRVYLPDR